MAGLGCTLDQIAAALEIPPRSLDRWRKLPAVDAAYQKGRVEAISEVAGTLYRRACEGDVTACIFFLKTQAGWKERDRDESPPTSNVVVYLPDNNR